MTLLRSLVSPLRSIVVLIGLALAQPALSAEPEPVTLEPLEFPPNKLVVTGSGSATVYDSLKLESELQTYRLVTTTPWRQTPATFEGVMLRDLLARHDFDGETGIKVTAENYYEVTIPADVLGTVPILIATRVDGEPHKRRARGPLQFVIPMEIHDEMGLTERYWVWMAARIEPLE